MIELFITRDEPVEYVCKTCRQLRLSLKGTPTECGNCGSDQIVTGARGTLVRP